VNLWPRDILCNERFPFSFPSFPYLCFGLSLSYLCEMPPPTFLAFLGLVLSVKVWILLECQPRTYVFLLGRSVEELECSDDADDQTREVPKSAILHLPPKLSLPVPASFSSLSSPSLWPLPIHGNDKTVTSRAISEVGSSHRLLPNVPPSPHSLSILGLGQSAMNGLLVSYVVNPNSLPISTFHLLASTMQDSRPLKSTEHQVQHGTGYTTPTDPISPDLSK
jgi:hypothetical protein